MGTLDLARFDQAMTAVIARHEALRTELFEADHELWRRANDPIAVKTSVLSAADYASALETAYRVVTSGIALTDPPNLRAIVVRYGSQKYLVVLVAPRTACDECSINILWRELAAHYAGRKVLGAFPRQHSEYIDAEHQWLAQSEAADQLEYWRRTLTGATVAFPGTVAMNVRSPGLNGKFEEIEIDSEIVRQVTSIGRECDADTYTVLIAAYLACIHRYTRREKLVIGVVTNHRAGPGSDMVGNLENKLPVPLSVKPRMPFLALVRDVARDLAKALTNGGDIPNTEIAKVLEKTDGPNHRFDLDISLQSWDRDSIDFGPDADGSYVSLGVEAGNNGVTLQVQPAGARWQARLACGERTAQQFGGARCLLESFGNLLRAAAVRPRTPISEIPLLSVTAASEKVSRANSSWTAYGGLRPIHRRFEEYAICRPDAVAVESQGRSFSYGLINARAARLAQRLAAAGIRREARVGVCIGRSVDSIVALLAVLKAGAAFVPISPDAPIAHTERIVGHSGMRALIVDDRSAIRLRGIEVPILTEEQGVPLQGRDEFSDQGVALGNVACVYYTSGSTGTPKGVAIEHGGAAVRLEWLLRRYQLAEGQKVLHKTPLNFDVAMWEVFGPLNAGATIVVAEAGAERDPERLAELLRAERIAFVHFVPSMLCAYLNYVDAEEEYPDLRWVQVSGEAMSGTVFERYRGHFQAELHNMYGQTETSEVAAWESSQHASPPAGNVTIGRQIGAYRVFVLDDALYPVPHGVPGELCVAAVGGLARCYHNDPRLTAQRFVPNPYSVTPGERLFVTRDLAVVEDDDTLTFVGRADDQVKIRGCRVEPSEVEAALCSHERVRSCAVVARQAVDGDYELVAYIVGGAVSSGDLSRHLAKLLPSYMQPNDYVMVETLPLTSSGKLDRMLLRSRYGETAASNPESEHAVGFLETELAALWKDLLGTGSIGRRTDFFVLGGNSLRMLRMLNRVRLKFHVRVSVQVFFDTPTIEGLAAQVEQALSDQVVEAGDEPIGPGFE